MPESTDEFLARADDVLTNWEHWDSADATVCTFDEETQQRREQQADEQLARIAQRVRDRETAPVPARAQHPAVAPTHTTWSQTGYTPLAGHPRLATIRPIAELTEAEREQLRTDFQAQLDGIAAGVRQFATAIGQTLQWFADRFGESFRQLAVQAEQVNQHLDPDPTPTDPRERALWLRRNRDTGPARPHFQRSAR